MFEELGGLVGFEGKRSDMENEKGVQRVILK